MFDFKNIKKENCWSKIKAQQYIKYNPYVIGMNYIPRTCINSTEMWMEDTFNIKIIKEELSLARKYCYNSIRVFLPFIVYEEEGNQFLDRIDKFLSVCERNDIKVTFVLFDDCCFSNLLPYYGKQRDPIPLVHNSGWTSCPGNDIVHDLNRYDELEMYEKAILNRFKDDKRVFMWDLYNECGNNKEGLKSKHLLESAFKWAREVNPSQPITSCIWAIVNGDALEECEELDKISYINSDIITFHYYNDLEHMKKLVDVLSVSNYPLICTEWMARGYFNCTIETILPYFASKNIGSYHWGFINGKTQTNVPWNYDISKGEPEIWFHDVFKKDFTPYSQKEMGVIKKIFVKKCYN